MMLNDIPDPCLCVRVLMQEFIQGLELPSEAKEVLLMLTPATYVGNAQQQALALREHLAHLGWVPPRK